MFTKPLRLIAAILISALFLMCASQVLAKGAPAKVIITGPGLTGEVLITDPKLLQAFSFFQFEDINHQIMAPTSPDEGYIVTRYVQDRSQAWDRVIYYPQPAGVAAIAFLEGLIGSSSTEFDGQWYQVSSEGDTAMRQLLAAHGVRLPKRNTAIGTATGPQQLPVTGTPAEAGLLLGIVSLLIIIFGVLMRWQTARFH
jgi:hypothetical protein